MADEKEPFYEVLAEKLEAARLRVVQDGRLEDLRLISEYLDILKRSGIPSEAARKIAEGQEDLPNLLAMVFGMGVADDATVTLQDLANRRDPPQTSKFDNMTLAANDLGDPPTDEEKAEQDLIDHGQ